MKPAVIIIITNPTLNANIFKTVQNQKLTISVLSFYDCVKLWRYEQLKSGIGGIAVGEVLQYLPFEHFDENWARVFDLILPGGPFGHAAQQLAKLFERRRHLRFWKQNINDRNCFKEEQYRNTSANATSYTKLWTLKSPKPYKITIWKYNQ